MTILLKIDCTKIDKSRLFEGKNGAKYLDAVLIETPDNEYGNSHMIVQSVSKEEREAGKRGPILGNAKTLGGDRPAPARRAQDRPPPRRSTRDEVNEEDVPF